MRFYLGAVSPNWLEKTDVPLFLSHRLLQQRRSMPRVTGPWAEDSGGYSELSMFGEWRTSAATYVRNVRRHVDEIGRMEWAAVQDWMCEPWIIEKTGLSVIEHQHRTVLSYLDLTLRAPEIPWAPVIQGWELDDYLRHVEMYARAGVDLTALPTVGVGSVCRRQGTTGAATLLLRLSGLGIRLHGFGLKLGALRQLAPFLQSADSMAWSYTARRVKAKCGAAMATCANHLHYALDWRQYVENGLGTESVQLRLAV